MTDKIEEKIGEIKTLIRNDLTISRVPRKSLQWFKEYAKEEFEGDYGMTLKHICDFYIGNYVTAIQMELGAVHTKLDKLLEQNEKKEEPKPKVKVMVDGTERRIE